MTMHSRQHPEGPAIAMRRISASAFYLTFALTFLALVIAGCQTTASKPGPERVGLAALEPHVAKVSAYIDGQMRGGGAIKSDWTARRTLEYVREVEPDLMAPFAGYAMTVALRGNNSSVLICSADGKHALFEDAGCSTRLDAPMWRSPSAQPCRFVLDLRATCPMRKSRR
jgi:hypothetical protein